MRSHLAELQKNLEKRDLIYAQFKSASDELDKADSAALFSLRNAGVSRPAVAGYLGAATKACSNLGEVHSALARAHAAHKSLMTKVVDGISDHLGITMSDRTNVNATVQHQGADTASPGEITPGLKGATARDLQKMSQSLPGSTPLASEVGHIVQKVLGRRNANENFDYGFSKATLVPSLGEKRFRR